MKKQILLIIIALIASLSSFSQETYKVGNTEYYYNQYYSTTGKPLVKRSESNKREFLKTLGYSDIPDGYEIDHIKPLSEGGSDDPSNMQLITIEQHKRKTARERANRANSTYSTYTRDYTTTTTNNNLYNNQNNNSTYSRTDSNGRAIYRGSRGGEYYLNSSGKKVYVKSKTTSTTRSSYSSPTYSTPRSSSTRTIQTGPRGGKYYINSNGNKTYVKKKN